MPLQTWRQTLITMQGDGVAVANTAAETSLLLGQAKYTLQTNFVDTIGKAFAIKAAGRISHLASATVLFRFKLGPTANIAVFADVARALNATAKTNVTWDLELALLVRAVGSGVVATILGTGLFTSEAVINVGANTNALSMSLPAGSPAVGTGFDSTVANVADLTVQWGAASASNTIQAHTYQLESLN
jgi:hypothetical protein